MTGEVRNGFVIRNISIAVAAPTTKKAMCVICVPCRLHVVVYDEEDNLTKEGRQARLGVAKMLGLLALAR